MRTRRTLHTWCTLWLALVAPFFLFAAPHAFAGAPAAHAVAGLSGMLAGDSGVDRATPRRSLQSFLTAARSGDFAAAAACLDPRGRRDATDGAELAEELSYALYRRPAIDLSQVPDEPDAREGQVVVDTFTVGDQEVPLALVRARFDDGVERWVIGRTTVRRIPEIAAATRGSAWEQKLPQRLRRPVVLGNAPWQWLGILVSLFLAYVVGRAAAAIATRIGASFAKRTTSVVDDLLVEAARPPLRAIFAAVAFGAFVRTLETSLAVTKALGHLAYSAFIVGLTWLLLAGFGLIARLISPTLPLDAAVPPDGAGERTRRALLQRVASAGVVGIAIALLLLQFDVVRHVGLSLLASAGIAGVVLGFAAQKSLAGLIAGIQLSITQPIRLGDVIFVEGEIGTVQDIYLTYAVVRFWDDRCVVVPLSRFLDQPFQNWTLLRRELSFVVLLHVKFTAPVPLLRTRLLEICEAHPKWDKRRAELQVGDSDASGMVLRCAVSAGSPADSWDLGCAVREGLIAYLRTLDSGAHLG